MTEKIVDLYLMGLRLLQNSQFLGVTEDTARLSEFAARMAPNAEMVCELGSGSGGLLLTLWARLPHARLVGVEVMAANVELARRSLALNAEVTNVAEHCRFVQADWRDWAAQEQFDLVVSNPPFWPQNAGRMSPVPEKRAATHEIYGGLADMLAAANRLLAARGTLCLLLPNERGQEACELLRKLGMEPAVQEKFARRVMIAAKKP